MLFNPTNPAALAAETQSLQKAAQFLGLRLYALTARTVDEIDAAFAALAGLGTAALIVSGDPFFTNRRDQIVTLAARQRVPSIYVWREFAISGGLMSYGNDLAEGYRKLGAMAGKILRGVPPSELPVQQAVKLSLVINLDAAKALGITVSPLLLAQADEVIE